MDTKIPSHGNRCTTRILAPRYIPYGEMGGGDGNGKRKVGTARQVGLTNSLCLCKFELSVLEDPKAKKKVLYSNRPTGSVLNKVFKRLPESLSSADFPFARTCRSPFFRHWDARRSRELTVLQSGIQYLNTRNAVTAPMADMKCPHCNSPIGVDKNRFSYDTVSYFEESKGKTKLKLEFVAVSCSKCGAVLGVTR